MTTQKSIEAYKEKRLNCAQSILSGFKDSHNVSDEEILEAKKNGGGRAPENKCGALHSASELVGDETAIKRIEAEFRSKAGSIKCREIRGQGKLSCAECVELSAKLLEEITEKKKESHPK